MPGNRKVFAVLSGISILLALASQFAPLRDDIGRFSSVLLLIGLAMLAGTLRRDPD